MEPGSTYEGQDHFICGLDPIVFHWLLLPGSMALGRAMSSPALAAFALQMCSWVSHRMAAGTARCKAPLAGILASH